MFFGWWEILNKEFIIFIPITFLLDIFKELITGYYDKGIIIKDHQKIAIKYFKTYLIFDLLAICPFVIHLFYNDCNEICAFSYILIFLKLKVLFSSKIPNFYDNLASSYKWHNWIELFKLVFMLFFIAHINAIVYFSIGTLEM